MNLKTIFFLLFTLSVSAFADAQTTTPEVSKEKKSSPKLNSSATSVSTKLEKNASNADLAKYYVDLADEVLKSGDTSKAIGYYNDAARYFKKAGNKTELSEVYRKVGKLNEAKKNFKEAYKNYNDASSNTISFTDSTLNQNDAVRVQNYNNPAAQLAKAEENLFILQENENTGKEELAQTYIQVAALNNEMKKPQEAIENLNKALDVVEDGDLANKKNIVNTLSEIYYENNNVGMALQIQKNLIWEAEKAGDIGAKIQQQRSLSDIYFKSGESKKGIDLLEQSYNLAIENSNLIEARRSLEMLVSRYEQIKDGRRIIPLYKSFISKLDTLIKSDSSIVDVKLFQISEQRIARLEKERHLKDELITRTKNFNFMLLGSVIVLFVLFFLIVKAWYSIKKRNKRIALQSLRREMNPHFIFNSLNSVNQFIASNNELEANKFLSSYSNLMRAIMENSNKDFISLSMELDLIKRYLELEKLRFADKFDYQIVVDEKIDTDFEKVPNMIIQPLVENSIWHGLRYKATKGKLLVKIEKSGGDLIVEIDDDGIGMRKSQELKTQNQKLHQSLGMKNVNERVALLNDLYKTKIRLQITDKQEPESGVKIMVFC